MFSQPLGNREENETWKFISPAGERKPRVISLWEILETETLVKVCLGWVTMSKSSCCCIIIAHHVKSSFRIDWLTDSLRCKVGARKLPHFKNWTFSQQNIKFIWGSNWHKIVGEMRKWFGEMTHIVGEMNHIVGEMKQIVGKWSEIVGEMKQNCWENDTSCWGSEAICVGEMPQIQSEATPDQTRPDQNSI